MVLMSTPGMAQQVIDNGEQVKLPSDRPNPWEAGTSLVIGQNGQGMLTASGASIAIKSQTGVLGEEAGSQGTVVLTNGAQWITSDTRGFGVALRGQGLLRVESGARLSNAGAAVLGRSPGSAGDVVLSGPGSSWLIGDTITVGYDGRASLRIDNGAKLSSGGTFSDIGKFSGSEGEVVVTGAGSAWAAGTVLDVGFDGRGSLRIDNGATVTSGRATIGSGTGSGTGNGGGVGDVVISGTGSSWVASGSMIVGGGKLGSLRIEDGAKLSNAYESFVGFGGYYSRAEAKVAGAGTSWSTDGDLHVGYYGSVGVLTLTDGGTVSAKMIRFQHQSEFLEGAELGLSSLNIGAAAGQAPAAPGRIEANGIVFNKNPDVGVINLNHTASDYVLSVGLSGNGAIQQLAGSTRLTGDSSGFTGITRISGGELRVDGTLGGTTSVLNGARLSGGGTIGTTTVESGATLAPGNTVGTFNINGDIRFDAGSIYEVEASPQGPDSDLVKVSGKANLGGGAVVHVGPDGDFKPDMVYTIVNAAAGIEGRFQSASSNFAFLSPVLSYDANNVYLGLQRSQIQFPDYALTRNQRAASQGIQSAARGHAVYDAVVLLPADGGIVRAAYDRLSGEVHASAKSALFDDSRYVREAALSRAGMEPLEGGFWALAYGGDGRMDSDGNADRLDRTTRGLLFGADRSMGEDWRVGVAAGYGRNNLDAEARGSSAKIEGYTLAAYAGTRVDGLGVRFGAAYSQNDIDSTRRIAFPGWDETSRVKYGASTIQGFAETGFRFERGESSVEPFVGLAYVRVNSDPYRESGLAGLVADKDSQDGIFTTLGLRADTLFQLASSSLRLGGLLGWRSTIDEMVPTATHAFSSGDLFTVASTPISRNAALVKVGVEWRASQRIALNFEYSGQIASDAKDHSLQATLTARF